MSTLQKINVSLLAFCAYMAHNNNTVTESEEYKMSNIIKTAEIETIVPVRVGGFYSQINLHAIVDLAIDDDHEIEHIYKKICTVDCDFADEEEGEVILDDATGCDRMHEYSDVFNLKGSQLISSLDIAARGLYA